jgi:hypothetical protein
MFHNRVEREIGEHQLGITLRDDPQGGLVGGGLIS